jgi:IS1 family transposase
MYRCEWCQQCFSETQGTAFFSLKTPAKTVYQALTALAEGVSIRSTARIFEEKPETILLWLRRAGEHSQQVSDYLLRDLHVSQAQMDELWTFVRKKEKNLSAWEQLHTEYGDTWVWVVFDPVNKLVLSLLVGEREEEQAVGVLNQLKARLVAGCLPLFTSDQLPHYLKALLHVFGRWIQPQRQGERGRFPNPRPQAPDDLMYATVDKHKQNGHLVSVTRQVVLGNPAAIAKKLEATRPGLKINTSFVERFNLTLRHLVSRLRRKGLTFSKKRKYLVWHLQLATAYYHFVRPHGALRQRLDEPSPTRGSPKLWLPRTPTMAAGLTDHIWSIKELLSFRVPPPITA